MGTTIGEPHDSVGQDRKLAKRSGSVYERVMANPRSRDAYFNTTRGVLSGNPEQEETKRVRTLMNERTIPHLFTPDDTLPRPVFYSSGGVGVGETEIRAVANHLSSLRT